MGEELLLLSEDYAKKIGFIEPAGGRVGEHRMALPDPSEEEVRAANAFLEQIWEDLPDADTFEWGDKRDHIEMGYEFGYTLPLHDLRDLLEDPQKHYFEKYENLPEGKEWPEANEDWLKRETLEVIDHSRWGDKRCREEMGGDPEHLIVLCKMGLEDSIKDVKGRLMPEEKKLEEKKLEEPYISKKETICNLVNMAKHDEKKAIKFYKELRDKVSPENRSLAETIEEIMKDEEDHYEKIIAILNECIDMHPRPVGGHIYLE